MDKKNFFLAPGIPDSDFLRTKVPITKQEVRAVSLSKLRLKEDSILFDVGSGSGSVSVEAALLSEKIKIFAIEKNEDALSLTKENVKKFDCKNVHIVKGSAPEVFKNLPSPSHAFIGGSGSFFYEILKSLYDLNPKMRIVINAVSLNTVSKAIQIPEKFLVEDFEVSQISVSHAEKCGSHFIMKAQNPVFIFSFNFKKQEDNL